MIKQYLEKIGKKIQFIRKSKNLSQEKLAEKINMSRNYIGMIERAEVNMPLGTLVNIANALDINPKDFFE